jgi:hypothetical protein
MRTLLKLYPRRIRNRYGDELLDLEDELRAQGEVSRTRLIQDMLAGALLIRPARRRARLVTGAVLVIVGLAIAGTIIGGPGANSPARASHPQVRLAAQSLTAIPYGSCFVATGSSCSLAPCTEFTGQTSVQDAVAHSRMPATQRRPRLTGTRCAAYPHARPQHLVFVTQVVKPTRPRR